ncbi:type IX secretion system membrane protein PorP/SprF [Flavobacteriaceae bacterium R38]|nr:type IX secretion system membrane protein PorP/SprF [Flavobacteriaceae bacterium R38]
MKNIYKIIILFAFIIGSSFTMKAQQEPLYTLYRYTTNFYNPAAFGLNERVEFKSNFRSQFTNIDQAPETQSFYLGVPVNDRIGIGFTAIIDEVFIENATSLFASFAYKLQLTEKTDLYFGIQAGGTFVNIDFTDLGLGADPLFAQNVNDFNPNIGAGIYIKNEKYFASLSSPRILTSERIDDDSGVLTSANNNLQVYLSGGYHLPISGNVIFTPSALLRFSDKETITDITGTFKFLERFEVGANYRIDRSLGGLLYISIQDWLEIGYAYEGNSSDINIEEDGTHEVGIALKF